MPHSRAGRLDFAIVKHAGRTVLSVEIPKNEKMERGRLDSELLG